MGMGMGMVDGVDQGLGHLAEAEVQALRGLSHDLLGPGRGDLVPFHQNSGGFTEGFTGDEGGAQAFDPLLLVPVGAGNRQSDAGRARRGRRLAPAQ